MLPLLVQLLRQAHRAAGVVELSEQRGTHSGKSLFGNQGMIGLCRGHVQPQGRDFGVAEINHAFKKANGCRLSLLSVP